jgi:hypothetical protein
MGTTEIVQTHRWEINSLTNPAKRAYIVSSYSNGDYRCSCPRWIFQKGGFRKDCKHIELVKSRVVNLVTAPPTVAPLPALPKQRPWYEGEKPPDTMHISREMVKKYTYSELIPSGLEDGDGENEVRGR